LSTAPSSIFHSSGGDALDQAAISAAQVSTSEAGRLPNKRTLHNTGTLGAFQVGDANVAHVTQTVSSEITTITDALKVVREQLPTLQDDERQEEIESYVAAIEGEVEKPAPRIPFVRTWLKNIGKAAGTVADWGGKAVVETAVSAAVRALTHP
jgi:hypothetical protein